MCVWLRCLCTVGMRLLEMLHLVDHHQAHGGLSIYNESVPYDPLASLRLAAETGGACE